MHGEVTARLRELHTTIEAGDRHREVVLQQIALNLDAWATQVRREKAIYHTLNKLSMDASRKVLVAEAWCPTASKPRVHEALRQAAEKSSTQVGCVCVSGGGGMEQGGAGRGHMHTGCASLNGDG
jgi:V-type H+-transporting ATPase subunit a